MNYTIFNTRLFVYIIFNNMYNIHCTLYSVQYACTTYIVRCTLYTVFVLVVVHPVVCLLAYHGHVNQTPNKTVNHPWNTRIPISIYRLRKDEYAFFDLRPYTITVFTFF